MKVAVSASRNQLTSSIELQFERAPCFIVFDLSAPGNAGYKFVPNPNAGSINDVGILAAQMLINLGIDVLITGWCDPNTLRIFHKANIPIFEAAKGTVQEVIAAIAEKKSPWMI